MQRDFDALVIGGGPAGATAALLLVRAGWSVALVERKEFPRPKVCGEYLSATNWPVLRALGLAEAFAESAGPPVRETAVLVGSTSVQAALPQPKGDEGLWGRALPRPQLDTLLLARAASAGAVVYQPGRCVALNKANGKHVCRIELPGQVVEVQASAVIAAHGSWDLGPLATERQAAAPRPADLLAFKAHFRAMGLPPGLMPLLSFGGGYGGMVHVGDGRASLSLCIRRSRLERLPRDGGQSAGDAVLDYLLGECPILSPVLGPATRDGAWLSAGPIQPGVRRCYHDGVFVVGNAAGEAHPVVAEGISMAMQSAWLLADLLIAARGNLHLPGVNERIGRQYTARWRQAFVPRIRAAAAVASWAMRPRLVAATLPLLRGWPGLLTLGAKLSGKARLVAGTTTLQSERTLCQP